MTIRRPSPSHIIVVLTVSYFGFSAIPIWEPATLWGISHAQYFDWQIRVAQIIGCLMMAAIVFAKPEFLKVSGVIRNVLLLVVVPAVLLAIFYFLRVKTHYLGDGILRAQEIEFGIKFLPTEPLGHYINHLGYLVFSALFGWSAVQSMAALSIISGIAFYFAVLDLTRTLFQRAEDRVVAFVTLYFSGTALLFCGYVESYSLLPALLTMYAASGIRAIENRGSAKVPVRLYLVLVLFHLQFLHLAPTLLFIAYQQYRLGQVKLARSGITAVLVSLAIVIIFPLLTGRPTAEIGNLLIGFAPNGSYWLLSSQHLLDIMNQLLLTAAASIILISALAVGKTGRPSWTQPRLLFVVLLLPGAAAIMTLLQPQLGYAADWDLFSSCGVIVGIFAVTLYSMLKDIGINRFAKITLVAAAFFSFLSYVMVNADADRSLERQVDILNVSGEYGARGFESLGTDMSKRGRDDLAEQMWKRSAEIAPHARVLGNLGQLALGQKRYAEAESYLRQSLALDSTRAIFTLCLGLTYVWQGRSDLGEPYLRKAVELEPGEAKYHHNLAVFLLQNERIAEAEIYSRRAVGLEPKNANYATTLGRTLTVLGSNAEAEKVLLQAIQLQPQLAEAYITLATVYRTEGQVARATQLLNDFIIKFPNHVEAARIKQALGGVAN